MDKTAIKNFSIWARRKLISEIIYKANLIGINEKEILSPTPASTVDLQLFDIGSTTPSQIVNKEIVQRNALIKEIKKKEAELSKEKSNSNNYEEAFMYVVEEIAYTWFNRLIAIRFMEVNDYLPSRVRVLSSETKGKIEPDIISQAFEVVDNENWEVDKEIIEKLKEENKLDELFRLLFIAQCNHLNKYLPELFEKTANYTELLLTLTFTDKDGVVSHLVNDIKAEDFEEKEFEGAVEIIGWMYQYYNTEPKDKVINIYKGIVKKEDIPAATQLFTTDWVVRYMVDNSLGRYWVERNPDSVLAEKLEYLITPKNGEIIYINEKISPEELTFFDPCMGSGHILVYAFDVLMNIYKECGYSDNEATTLIIEKNLYGADIDKRAYQLAYFAVMMRARKYDRRFLTRKAKNNLIEIEDSLIVTYDNSMWSGDQVPYKAEQEYLLNIFEDAKNIGSILNVENKNWETYTNHLVKTDEEIGQITLGGFTLMASTTPKLLKLAKQAQILSSKYSIVCTNPPYLNKMNPQLKSYVAKYYKEYSGDMFSVFMYKNFDYCKQGGYSAFMTPFVWMFIKTYEKLREYIINQKSITSLIQMEYSAFEEATVPICSFVLKNGKEKGLYIKLSDFKGGMEVQKQKVLEALKNKECGYFYETNAENFSKIPGMPVAYWVSEKIIAAYDKGVILGGLAYPKTGMTTGDNNRFLRLWYEVAFEKCCFDANSSKEANGSLAKWFPYCKGGGFKRWYGYNEYLVNWENNGYEIKNNIKDNGLKAASVRSESLYFKSLITWSTVTSGSFSCRSVNRGFLFDSGGSSISVHNNKFYLLAFLNGVLGQYYLNISNATINYQPGDIAGLPIIMDNVELIESLVARNISLSKTDWDGFETSWDFTKHPLI